MSRKFIVVTTTNFVRTVRMNNPKKLNAWTLLMLEEIRNEFKLASEDPGCKALILTGTDPYYCAGVDLSSLFKPMGPRAMSTFLEVNNQKLFEIFLNFNKPMIAAVNGPSLGASATSATLCDAIIASEKASFHTPFARLGITPEGCSSVHFERLIGANAANKMLKEDWKIDASTAKDIGFVTDVVKHELLQETAQKYAEKFINERKERSAMGFDDFDHLREVNIREAKELAETFVSAKFLNQQYTFLSSKGKTVPAMVFKLAAITRPIWALFL